MNACDDAGCQACRAELPHLQEALALFKDAVVREGERPPEFWLAQRAEIVRSTTEQPTARGLRLRPALAWAAAAAAAVMAGVWLGLPAAPTASAPPADADHELLLAVERSLRRDVPAALEPALLITADLERKP